MAVEFPASDRLMRAMIHNIGLMLATLILLLACTVKLVGGGVLWESHLQTEPDYRPHPYDGANDMPKVDDETLRKRYEQAKVDWDERQKENRARQRREKAQADARRKTLIGGMVLRRVQQNPHERERLMTGLDSFLEDARDRALFDLPPRSESPASVPSTEPSPSGDSSPQ